MPQCGLSLMYALQAGIQECGLPVRTKDSDCGFRCNKKKKDAEEDCSFYLLGSSLSYLFPSIVIKKLYNCIISLSLCQKHFKSQYKNILNHNTSTKAQHVYKCYIGTFSYVINI